MTETLLTPEEVRVLGALIEKEMTTPFSYPLTLNALTSACNQKSNRDPVVEYDESTVLQAVDGLRGKRLVETVFPGSSRTAKYKHDFAYEYGLNGKLQALLGVLMLRGPQTGGELRTRTERMTRFDTIQEVMETLDELITREEGPLVTLLPPGPGQKERRYAHLLSGEPAVRESSGRGPGPAADASGLASASAMEERIEALERAMAELREEWRSLRRDLGADDAQTAATPDE